MFVTDVSHKETNKGSAQSKNDKSTVDSKKSQPQEMKKNLRVNLFPVSGPASNKKEKALLCCEQLLRNEGLLPYSVAALGEKKTEEPDTSTDKQNEQSAHLNGEIKMKSVLVVAEEAQSGNEEEREKNQTLHVGNKKENGIEAPGTNDDKTLELTSMTDEFESLTIKDLPNIGYFTTQENMQVMLDADGMYTCIMIMII
jgi:hypothetical protein